MSLVIYTDGACEPNPGQGGWGFVAYLNGEEFYRDCGGSVDTTNNIMEMTAVIRAIEWLTAPGSHPSALIYSDSQYVVKGCNEWRHNWKKKNWKRKPNGESGVKNLDLWLRLDHLLSIASVRLEWCKGHAGVEGNELADVLAEAGRLVAIAENGTMAQERERLLDLMGEPA